MIPLAPDCPIHFYSPIAFEPWDWRNSVEGGIGGSETSQVEMAWRLARRGHPVTCYAPLPDDCTGYWRGTHWLPIAAANFSDPGLWIIYRDPAAFDRITPRADQQFWLLWQDWDYPALTEARASKVDRHVTLCQWHARYMASRYPFLADKIWITSNGLKWDLLESVEFAVLPHAARDPRAILFASSPDRGLSRVIAAVARAREVLPDLTLHVTYGFNNLDKLPQLAAQTAALKALLAQPFIVNHGRVSQPDLYRLWLSCGLWVYPTTFHETSCITSMEAQACGAIPIVSPVAALAENVLHGCLLQGDPNEPLIAARFANEIVRFADPHLQASIRPAMMADARVRFDWERMVDQWHAVITDTPYPHPFPVQLPAAAPQASEVCV